MTSESSGGLLLAVDNERSRAPGWPSSFGQGLPQEIRVAEGRPLPASQIHSVRRVLSPRATLRRHSSHEL